ncbi:hypothetical protein [Segniliparus rugosus]|uniref:Lipoprotein n=1 Tax=Segniliparus rugosus (strain ATCC BAA-974 / DSM 45345 / CCUG 50838 / CIP 108380 / JCM 13579 / CDC 945) TaxID=679197 RepID=E5XM94_SEGRC|nr:hypothetical protein [Segniliparus rugosus]EFV14539.1 hypothetical protein HMPREF9336_00614 [Segniliparus rugosus ATCC BAA-974]
MMRKSAALILLATLIAGCSPHPPSPDERQPSNDGLYHLPKDTANVRFVWSAEPGIDLTTGPAALVRAYRESYEIAFLNQDLHAAYPGFERATDPKAPARLEVQNSYDRAGFFRPIINNPNPDYMGYHYGTIYFHMLSLRQLDDGSWESRYCEGDYSLFKRQADGKYRYYDQSIWKLDDNFLPEKTSELRQIRFDWEPNNTPSNPAAPSADLEKQPPQSGPLPAPTRDVFDRWRIIRVEPSMALSWKPCYDKMPDSPEKRMQILKSVLDAPPPLPAPVPGWPAAQKG